VGELAAHKLDLVLADAPVGPGVPVRAFNPHRYTQLHPGAGHTTRFKP
jgi:hypothetical protein